MWQHFFLPRISNFWLKRYPNSSLPKTNRLRFNPLSANPTKWSNTLKQFVGKKPTNCLSVFDHFVKLALKRLKYFTVFYQIYAFTGPQKSAKFGKSNMPTYLPVTAAINIKFCRYFRKYVSIKPHNLIEMLEV